MKKLYGSPEMEIVELKLNDVILNSPTENSVPDQPGVNIGNGGGTDLNNSDLP